jgi:putative acetyltransferase
MQPIIYPAEVEDVYACGLIAELDEELLARYPGEPINGIEPDEFRAAGGYFVVARVGAQFAGCGAFRPVDPSTVEIKRMFIRAAHRRGGLARLILAALEAEASRRGFSAAILETARRMPEAIDLYRSSGYEITARYGHYVDSERSICMRRALPGVHLPS